MTTDPDPVVDPVLLLLMVSVIGFCLLMQPQRVYGLRVSPSLRCAVVGAYGLLFHATQQARALRGMKAGFEQRQVQELRGGGRSGGTAATAVVAAAAVAHGGESGRASVRLHGVATFDKHGPTS